MQRALVRQKREPTDRRTRGDFPLPRYDVYSESGTARFAAGP
jgi:hypothetical protein